MNLPEEIQLIEPIRQRAKDSKSQMGTFFLDKALDSLENLRNILILTSSGLVGFKVTQNIEKISLNHLLASLLVGFVSYLLSYFYFFRTSELYSQLEGVWSKAFISVSEYKQNLKNEAEIKKNFSNRNNFHGLVLICSLLQLILIIWSVRKLVG